MKHFLGYLVITIFIFAVQNITAQAINNLDRNALNNVRNDKNFLSDKFDNKFYSQNNSLNRKLNHVHIPNKKTSPINPIYLPDTLILISTSDSIRMTASYTQAGLTEKILAQVWYGGHWANYRLQTWTYFSTNEDNLTLTQYSINGQWINAELDSSTYDANGNMLVHLYKYWFNGSWIDSMLSSRTYDANGNMLSNVGWVKTNIQWTNSWRGTYTYDTSGNNLTFYDEMWSNGQWVNMNKWTYTYDENGHMLTCLTQVWYGQWENATLSTYTYDGKGNMISFLLQHLANGIWTNYTMDAYTYNANGKMLTDLYKGWANDAWMNGTLYTYTYDTNDNLVNELIQEWLNGAWTNYKQSNFTYDVNGNERTGKNTIWSGSSWVPKDDTFKIIIDGDENDFYGYSIYISYTLINPTDVRSKTDQTVTKFSLSQNYPNPFNPTTKIKYSIPNVGTSRDLFVQIIVYDVLGKKVASLVNEEKPAGSYEVEFDASNLPSGVYFYRLKSGEFLQTLKMILMK